MKEHNNQPTPPERDCFVKHDSVNKMGNSLSGRDKNEAEFGDKLFETVYQIYPESSENITGMLLELEHQELERLLTTTNQDELHSRIHQAAGNIPSSNGSERVYYEQAKIDSVGLIPELVSEDHPYQKTPHPLHNTNKHDKSIKSEIDNSYTSWISSVDHGNLESKQALGEQIYYLIKEQHPNDAEKLTGILLEMDNESLENLIKDTDLLEEKVEDVLSVLQNKTGHIEDDQNESVVSRQAGDKTSLGEQLYELVYALDSDYADRITGMLLEMDLPDLEKLVKHQDVLEEKVHQALMALNSEINKQETASSQPEQEDKTLLGEQLYYLISEWYPNQADKITGMLLELDVTTLNLLVTDSTALKEKAAHAANVLSETSTEKETLHSSASTKDSVQESGDKELSDSEMKQALAEQLYYIIEQQYPNEAEKLTGMLMELDCKTLETMVLNEQLLKEKLEGALAAIHRPEQTESDREPGKCQNQDDIAREELGEKLFEKVEESHPEDADKITGMLLEMNVEEIERLLKNPQELQEKIQLADNALG